MGIRSKVQEPAAMVRHGCGQYFIPEYYCITNGSVVNSVQLYDMHTPGMTVVSFGIAKTSGEATTPLTTTVVGDTVFAIIDSTALIAAGYGNTLSATQRIYVHRVSKSKSVLCGTWASTRISLGFCYAGPCQDLSTTAGVQDIGAAALTGGLDPSSVFNKCFGTQEEYQVFNVNNTGTGPANNLTFSVSFDTTTYSAM
jgi:hypothetical protein